MATIRGYLALVLCLLLLTCAARAEDQPLPPEFYDRPTLVVDIDAHTGEVPDASVDRAGHWAVTGSHDKTLRIWSLADGKLARTIRVPAGPDRVGNIYAVAISPDGALIAAGGVTRTGGNEQIYLFDRENGILVSRIEGLPGYVDSLAFSPDGDRLAAGMSGNNGVRVYDKGHGWEEVARDRNYSRDIYGVDFGRDGRLAVASTDGDVSLYAPGFAGEVRPEVVAKLPGQPFRIAFSPDDGERLAVGNYVTGTVALLDGHTLALLSEPDISGLAPRVLTSVAWSRDGGTLLAGGNYVGAGNPVFRWSEGGAGPRQQLANMVNTVTKIVALPEGDLLAVVNSDLFRLGPDGITRWTQHAQVVDFTAQSQLLTVSADGERVAFGYDMPFAPGAWFFHPASFDVLSRILDVGPGANLGTAPPRRTGLNVQGWHHEVSPTLDGKVLIDDPTERSHSLAIHPSGQSFVLGTDYWLRAYGANGALLWRHAAPDTAWAVNITGDGKIVVAAYGDGTIRWHRMDNGVELLAFMPMADRSNWISWTPEGFYGASPGAHGVLRWHVNRGWGAAESVAVEDIPGSYRPEVLPLVLRELETTRALGVAEQAEHNRQVMLRTHSHISPGARLYLLTVGIDQYNEEHAKNLQLHFAGRDAHDLASAIVNTQGALYDVRPTVLLDKDANKTAILRALKAMREAMEGGNGNDLAVIHFSGHGALVDNKLYLLPYEVDARDEAGIQATGLLVDQLKDEMLKLGQHGRVLVLLDACHSGAATMGGAPLSMDSTALRTSLAAANISVLTSSTGAEVSFEKPELQHGAFTKALLEALDDPAADINHNGLVTPNGLASYVGVHVPMLTGDQQHPGQELRYETTLFANSR